VLLVVGLVKPSRCTETYNTNMSMSPSRLDAPLREFYEEIDRRTADEARSLQFNSVLYRVQYSALSSSEALEMEIV
jgi:hypothetical protein